MAALVWCDRDLNPVPPPIGLKVCGFAQVVGRQGAESSKEILHGGRRLEIEPLHRIVGEVGAVVTGAVIG